MYKTQLQNLGLTEKEAKIYEILLKLGPSPITPILKDGQFKKGDTYNVLRSLEAKDLITEDKSDKKTIFQAKQPQELNKLIRKREKELETQKVDLEKLIPDLSSIYQSTTDKPIVQIQEGIEGLRFFYQDLLKTGQDFIIFVSKFHRRTPELEELVEHQIKKQQKAKMMLQALNPIQEIKYDLEPNKYLKWQKENGADVRFVPNEFSFDSQIFVYGNKVAIVSLKNELMTTMIENENISNTMKTLFNFIWQGTASFHEDIIKNNKYPK